MITKLVRVCPLTFSFSSFVLIGLSVFQKGSRLQCILFQSYSLAQMQVGTMGKIICVGEDVLFVCCAFLFWFELAQLRAADFYRVLAVVFKFRCSPIFLMSVRITLIGINIFFNSVIPSSTEFLCRLPLWMIISHRLCLGAAHIEVARQNKKMKQAKLLVLLVFFTK